MSVSAKPSEAAPTRPRLRIWRRLAGVVALLLLLPVALVALLLLGLNTQPGRDMLARVAARFVPGLSIESLQGPLPGRPGLDRLTYADAQGVWLEVEGARIAWDPLALLRREAHIALVHAERVVLHRPPAASETAPEPAAPGPLIPSLPDLPFALRLDRLEVGRIELGPAVAGEPLVLRASGAAQLQPWGLSLQLDAGEVAGSTSLTLDATLRPGSGRLTTNARLRGEAGGPLSRLAGMAERPLSLDLRLDGPAEGAAFTLAAQAGQGLGANLSGTLSAPDTSRFALVTEGRVEAMGLLPPEVAGLVGPLDLRLDAARLPDGLLDVRALHISGQPGIVQAEGRLDTAGDRSALKLHAALPPSSVFAGMLPDAVGWDALEAAAEITGPLATPQVAATLLPSGFRSAIAPVAALLGPTPRITLNATAPDRIGLLSLAGQAIQAEVSGAVGDPLDLRFAADLAAPGDAVPGLSGALRLSGTARGARNDPSLTLEVASERLEMAGRVLEALRLSARIATPVSRPQVEAEAQGRVEDLPLSLAVRGTPEGDWLHLQAAEASLGPARLTAAGRFHPGSLMADGEARLEAPDLAPFARLAGHPLGGAVRLEARGTPRDGTQDFAVRLEVPRLAAAGVTARDVTATAQGTLSGFDIAFTGTANDINAEARGRLVEQDGARRLDLATLRATGFEETIRLASPTRITLRPDGGVEIAPTTLTLPRNGSLRAQGIWGPERADLRATLAAMNLAGFAALLPPDVAPAGTVTGEARITGPVAAPEVQATLRGTGLRTGLAAGLPAAELRVDLRRAGEGAVTANAEARIGPQQRLAATARFPRGPAADAPFEATLDGNLDLGPLTAPLLAAGADRVGGRLVLGLRASGTPNAPQFGGEARLSGGSYRNVPMGVAITDLAGTVRPDGSRLRADFTGRTPGEGRIALAGTIEPLSPDLPLDLTLTARNAQPVSSDMLRAVMDAELRLAGALNTGATLGGTVNIQRAEIRIPEKLAGGVRSLGPVTERGRPVNGARPAPPPRPRAQPRPAEAEGGLPITLAVQVSAPRNVFVRGRGLDAELGGAVRVGGRINAPQITGALDLRRGDVAVINRRLTLERGRLAWDGDLLPNLDLRASSQAGQVTVRVDVSGPPTDPQITFSSTPDLPQDEILARLLFDRPLRDLSALEIAQIGAALAGATGMAGGGPTGFIDRIRQGLGLDRLSVGGGSESAASSTSAEERNTTTVEAGRYVADGVYVGVRQGTDGGAARVGVRVDLTPRLRLEAETGDREAGNRVGFSWEWQWGR